MLAGVAAAVGAALQRAGAGAASPPFRPEVLVAGPAGSALRAAVWADRARYQPGDALRLELFVSRTAHLLVYAIDPEDRVRLLLPNGHELRSQVPPGTHRVPGGDYRLRLAGLPGPYYVQLLATLLPSPVDWAQAVRSAPFPLLEDDARRFRERLLAALQPHGPGWAAAWTAFTVGAGQP